MIRRDREPPGTRRIIGAAAAAWVAATPAIGGCLNAGRPSRRTSRPSSTPIARPAIDRAPASFSLLTYDEVRDKGADVAASTSARRMPPWHATPDKGFPALLTSAGSRTNRSPDQELGGARHAAGNARDLPRPPAFRRRPGRSAGPTSR
jgi:hypothetical protein